MALQSLQTKMQHALEELLPSVCADILDTVPWLSISAMVGITLPLDQVILIDIKTTASTQQKSSGNQSSASTDITAEARAEDQATTTELEDTTPMDTNRSPETTRDKRKAPSPSRRGRGKRGVSDSLPMEADNVASPSEEQCSPAKKTKTGVDKMVRTNKDTSKAVKAGRLSGGVKELQGLVDSFTSVSTSSHWCQASGGRRRSSSTAQPPASDTDTTTNVPSSLVGLTTSRKGKRERSLIVIDDADDAETEVIEEIHKVKDILTSGTKPGRKCKQSPMANKQLTKGPKKSTNDKSEKEPLDLESGLIDKETSPNRLPKNVNKKGKTPKKGEGDQPVDHPMADPGQSPDHPMADPGQSSDHPMADPGQSSDHPMTDPEQSSDHPMVDAGQSSDHPMADPGQSSDHPMADPDAHDESVSATQHLSDPDPPLKSKPRGRPPKSGKNIAQKRKGTGGRTPAEVDNSTATEGKNNEAGSSCEDNTQQVVPEIASSEKNTEDKEECSIVDVVLPENSEEKAKPAGRRKKGSSQEVTVHDNAVDPLTEKTKVKGKSPGRRSKGRGKAVPLEDKSPDVDCGNTVETDDGETCPLSKSSDQVVNAPAEESPAPFIDSTDTTDLSQSKISRPNEPQNNDSEISESMGITDHVSMATDINNGTPVNDDVPLSEILNKETETPHRGSKGRGKVVTEPEESVSHMDDTSTMDVEVIEADKSASKTKQPSKKKRGRSKSAATEEEIPPTIGEGVSLEEESTPLNKSKTEGKTLSRKSKGRGKETLDSKEPPPVDACGDREEADLMQASESRSKISSLNKGKKCPGVEDNAVEENGASHVDDETHTEELTPVNTNPRKKTPGRKPKGRVLKGQGQEVSAAEENISDHFNGEKPPHEPDAEDKTSARSRGPKKRKKSGGEAAVDEQVVQHIEDEDTAPTETPGSRSRSRSTSRKKRAREEEVVSMTSEPHDADGGVTTVETDVADTVSSKSKAQSKKKRAPEISNEEENVSEHKDDNAMEVEAPLPNKPSSRTRYPGKKRRGRGAEAALENEHIPLNDDGMSVEKDVASPDKSISRSRNASKKKRNPGEVTVVDDKLPDIDDENGQENDMILSDKSSLAKESPGEKTKGSSEEVGETGDGKATETEVELPKARSRGRKARRYEEASADEAGSAPHVSGKSTEDEISQSEKSSSEAQVHEETLKESSPDVSGKKESSIVISASNAEMSKTKRYPNKKFRGLNQMLAMEEENLAAVDSGISENAGQGEKSNSKAVGKKTKEAIAAASASDENIPDEDEDDDCSIVDVSIPDKYDKRGKNTSKMSRGPNQSDIIKECVPVKESVSSADVIPKEKSGFKSKYPNIKARGLSQAKTDEEELSSDTDMSITGKVALSEKSCSKAKYPSKKERGLAAVLDGEIGGADWGGPNDVGTSNTAEISFSGMKECEIHVKRLPNSIVNSLPHLSDDNVAKLSGEGPQSTSYLVKRGISKELNVGQLISDLGEDDADGSESPTKQSDVSRLPMFNNSPGGKGGGSSDMDDVMFNVTMADDKHALTKAGAMEVDTSAEEEDGGTLSDYSARLNQSLYEMESESENSSNKAPPSPPLEKSIDIPVLPQALNAIGMNGGPQCENTDVALQEGGHVLKGLNNEGAGD